jgi:hypothetical protein
MEKDIAKRGAAQPDSSFQVAGISIAMGKGSDGFNFIEEFVNGQKSIIQLLPLFICCKIW